VAVIEGVVELIGGHEPNYRSIADRIDGYDRDGLGESPDFWRGITIPLASQINDPRSRSDRLAILDG
jgi:hypothetical protein